jgi:hypothetical protein
MYQFILNQWILDRVDEVFVNYQYEKNRITKEERDMILATPKNI